ncbi:helix-turn-helix domain-containing protein [Hyphobacterium sp.]|uniref:helix-turn-helix domain-containing protein n=1 Tax=Hyphobacterium sp. TaxID=2004662 RepID=UPI00374896DA
MEPAFALSLLHAFAALNGLIVSVILITTGKPEFRRPRLSLGGFLFSGSVLLALFVLLDRSIIFHTRLIGILLEIVSAAMPALFLDYVMTTTGRLRGRNWLYLSVPAFTIAAVLFGEILGAASNFSGAIALQMLATTVGAYFWWTTKSDSKTTQKRHRVMRLLPYLFGLMAALHLSQIARFLVPASELLFDLVPSIGTLGLTAFVVATLLGSRTLSDLVKTPAERPVDFNMEAALQDKLVLTGAILDPGVTLEKLAGLMPIEPHKLSGYINATRGQTFREWLAGCRIAHAKALLSNPDESRTSIEAIGLLSGFKSRSAFYEAFKTVTGVSPNRFREKSLNK